MKTDAHLSVKSYFKFTWVDVEEYKEVAVTRNQLG